MKYSAASHITIALAVAIGTLSAPAAAQTSKEDPQVARGRYLIQIAGCNDCHTPG